MGDACEVIETDEMHATFEEYETFNDFVMYDMGSVPEPHDWIQAYVAWEGLHVSVRLMDFLSTSVVGGGHWSDRRYKELMIRVAANNGYKFYH